MMTKKWCILRLLRIFIYLAVLLFLLVYGYKNNPAITLQMCLDDPDKYNGTPLEIGNEIIVHSVTRYGFIIRQMDRLIEVRGHNDNIEPHDYIVLKAIFHKGPWLELQDYHVAKKRRTKVYISIFPALFIMAYFFSKIRFTRDGLGWKDA